MPESFRTTDRTREIINDSELLRKYGSKTNLINHALLQAYATSKAADHYKIDHQAAAAATLAGPATLRKSLPVSKARNPRRAP